MNLPTVILIKLFLIVNTNEIHMAKVAKLTELKEVRYYVIKCRAQYLK